MYKKDNNLGAFQDIFLDDDDTASDSKSPTATSTKRKTSMVLPLAHTRNVDNDDNHKSLTPVNEIQAFIPNDVEYGTASLITSLSATSDSSTPKLESRKMSNAYTETPYVTYLKKSSTSNTLKDDGDSDESNRPKLRKQEKFCYNRSEGPIVARCQCAECFELSDKESNVQTDGEISPSAIATFSNNDKYHPIECDFQRRQSSSESSILWSSSHNVNETIDEHEGYGMLTTNNRSWKRQDHRIESDSSNFTCSRSRYILFGSVLDIYVTSYHDK